MFENVWNPFWNSKESAAWPQKVVPSRSKGSKVLVPDNHQFWEAWLSLTSFSNVLNLLLNYIVYFTLQSTRHVTCSQISMSLAGSALEDVCRVPRSGRHCRHWIAELLLMLDEAQGRSWSQSVSNLFLTNRNYSKSKSLSLVILIRLDHMNDLAINLFALQTPSRNTEAGDWQETYIDVDLVW